MTARPENRTAAVPLVLLVLLALALRIDFLVAGGGVIDADEAIVGLMAKHHLEGRELPTFYYGQHYMGSLEPLLVSFVFRLFGVSAVALKVVPLLFSLLLVPLVYLLARAITDRGGALLAATLIALPPSPLVVWSAMARGGFIELVVIGALALLVTCRWLRAPTLRGTTLIGLLLGIGWWVNNQILFFMGPIGLMMLLRGSRLGWATCLRHLGAGLGAWLLGGAPFWLYNLRHDFVSFRIFQPAAEAGLGDQVAGLFATALPILFGARRFWHDVDVFTGATVVAWAMYILLFTVIVCCRWRALRDLGRGRVDAERPVELFLLFFITTCAVFALSSYGHLVEAPRYLLPAYLGLFVLAAYAVRAAGRRVRLLEPLLVAGLVGLSLASCYFGGRAVPGEPFVASGERVSPDHRELITWLQEQRIDLVRTNYWIGYRLAFETGEQVRFLMFQEPHQIRIPEYERAAPLIHDEVPLVLVPAQRDPVTRALRLLGFSFEVTERSGYVVVFNIRPRYPDLREVRGIHRAVASHGFELVSGAIDDRDDTRWGSGHHQVPGMVFKVDFDSPQPLRGIRYYLGQWVHDYPRGLVLSAVGADGTTRPILKSGDMAALMYYLAGGGEFTLLFDSVVVTSVILSTEGTHPLFDWSIAELDFFG